MPFALLLRSSTQYTVVTMHKATLVTLSDLNYNISLDYNLFSTVLQNLIIRCFYSNIQLCFNVLILTAPPGVPCRSNSDCADSRFPVGATCQSSFCMCSGPDGKPKTCASLHHFTPKAAGKYTKKGPKVNLHPQFPF